MLLSSTSVEIVETFPNSDESCDNSKLTIEIKIFFFLDHFPRVMEYMTTTVKLLSR